ncbi:MAG TPA: potassium-transporting ATPase subunit KdpC [Candidatus Angelobacter sp.]|jgi:K+-transporting ATPase ATPase C chain|nr:potassium-transporting ATPase subunit KdpC [Candidatus Angelobacter sp.]
MKRNLFISIWMTLATTVLLGIIYPLVVTGLAQMLFPRQANGELIQAAGKLQGSALIGQPFTAPGYFHSRPSAAGAAGYDASNSSGSNLAPTNKALLDRVSAGVTAARAENPNAAIPVDLVTASGSGLDPDISPAAAEFQIPRVARERGLSESDLRAIVSKHTLGRQFGFLGEPRVNVLELNLDLDAVDAMR